MGKINLAYIAGFFDGEGSIGVYTNGSGGCHLKLQVVQTESIASYELLSELAQYYGGSVAHIKPWDKYVKWKYNWQVSSNKAAEFLQDVAPFLRLKWDQVQVALAWYRQRPPLKRSSMGTFLPRSPMSKELDIRVIELMKALKRHSLEQVMKDQADLCEPIEFIRPILNYKGQ